jgi:arylsulfatase A
VNCFSKTMCGAGHMPSQTCHRVAVSIFPTVLVLAWLGTAVRAPAADDGRVRPNIVFILADDLGYGDLGCYGAKVKTPHLDRLASEGRVFADAHSSAAVCTATRYAIMTGREWFRRGKKWNYELTVPVGCISLPSLLKSSGYATGLIGKWHLGYGEDAPDWNGELKPGPLECGFDCFFGTAMTHNEPPQVLVEGHRVVNLSPDDPITIVPPPPGVMFGVMQGGKSARVVHHELGALHTEKAVKFIEERKGGPFFLYYGMINVHGPLAPGKRFQGTSPFGPYGDYVQELDWSVGEVLATLDRLELADDTLVIFTSDNGGVLHPKVVEAGHRANADLLGQKTDVWEGGHRVPFMVRWPGHVPPGTRTGELICLADMLATLAAVLGRELGPDDAPDSFNVLPAILDEPGHKPVRRLLTSTGIFGMAVREGKWKLIPGHGSAGFSTVPNHAWTPPWKAGRTTSDYTSDGQLKPDAPPGQLYDLEQDPGETTNLYRQHPAVVERLTKVLEQLRKENRGQREVAAELEQEPPAE